MTCTAESRECGCIICLELNNDDSNERENLQVSAPMRTGDSSNFILRRALPLVAREPTKEWQEEAASDPEPEPTPLQHKTVIYFGDSAERSRDTNVSKENKEDEPDFVLSVKPGREDVLRIEQDEEETCFKPDWSFVQQWRLRGCCDIYLYIYLDYKAIYSLYYYGILTCNVCVFLFKAGAWIDYHEGAVHRLR